jgi:DnaJ family protein C protein 13
VQGVLTGEPRIVEMAASLMEVIITYNPPAMARLYASGAFYFALAYGGANLRTISSLFKKAHLHQAFHG